MILKCYTNLVRCRHFGDAPDLSDFRGGAFPRMVHFPKEPSSIGLIAPISNTPPRSDPSY